MIFYSAVEPGTLHTKIIGTQADARAINKDFVQIDIPTDKAGLMAWANDMQNQIDVLRDQLRNQDELDTRGDALAGNHIDRDLRDHELPDDRSNLQEAEPVAPPLSYAERSIAIEDAWEALPMCLKLHYASLAMQDAYDALCPLTPKPKWGEQQ